MATIQKVAKIPRLNESQFVQNLALSFYQGSLSLLPNISYLVLLIIWQIAQKYQ